MKFKLFLSHFLVLSMLNLSANWVHAAKGDAFAVPDKGASRGTDILRVDSENNQVKPGADNTYTLGTSALRWSDIKTLDATIDSNATLGVTAVVALSSTTSITPSSSYVLVGSTGSAITLSSLPNITTSGANTGQLLIVRSTGPAVTVQDSVTLASSGVTLRAVATLSISSHTPRGFIFDGTNWVNLF